MAEQLPDGITKPGHRIDPGPFILDLYRLVCIVLADKQVAQTGHLRLLQGEYRDIEVIRILISIARRCEFCWINMMVQKSIG
jgi:hypothetical protein